LNAAYYEFSGISKRFDVSLPFLQRALQGAERRFLHAVSDVSFAIEKGKTLSLVGESGCGKSTVARIAVGVYEPDDGHITFDGHDFAAVRHTHSLRRRLNMVFQDPYSSLDPQWSVGRIIAEPIRAFDKGLSRAQVAERVGALLVQVGLSSIDAAKFPHEFSGGQRQRISIARSLASNPDFLICDEPTSALDVSIQAQILNLMKALQAERQLTYLFISHNLSVVRQMSDAVAVMYLGRIVEIGDCETVLDRPSHPYTTLLMKALPRVTMDRSAALPIAGDPPNPMNPPSGCAFRTRCPLAHDICAAERPRLERKASGAMAACHKVD